MKDFVHLHNHSDRSLLDGLQTPQQMATKTARLKQLAIGLTDHGNLHGAYNFYNACQKEGVKPIIGIEAYLAPGDRTIKTRITWGTPEQAKDDVSSRGSYTHLSMWATSEVGLRNLYALTSDSYMNGKLGKHPRMDREIISQHAEGLVGTTGCPSGEVQTRLRLGQFDEALKAAATYRDIFGKDRYFLELMNHGLDIESRVLDDLLVIGKKLNLLPLVTNDSHYSEENQADTHDALLCVNTGSLLSDEDRFKFGGSGYYLKSSEEMYAIDSSDIWQQGCANTLLVAEMAEDYGELFERRDLMPRFPCPKNYDEESLLRKLSYRGLEMKLEAGKAPKNDPRYKERLDYELDVIIKMGFPGYFLIVGDAVSWAKRNNIETGPGRGSAAASLVCWVLGITAVDPIEYDLVFERFLNPERVTMPDIDLDFEDKDRVGVYLSEKYGEDRVARISTLMEIKSKNALKDSARVLGAPYVAGEVLTKALPPNVFGTPAPLVALKDKKHPRYEEMGDLRKLAEQGEYADIVSLASRLEGTTRGVGIHAGGVVVSCRSLVLDIPLAVQSSHAVTQYDMNEVEALGLLKIDTLGLITLGTLRRAIEATGVDRNVIPLDDEKAWALLGSGHTTGLFQLESSGMQSALRQIRPTNLGDLAAVIALYRPGPMGVIPMYAMRKHGKAPVEPIHPGLKEALAPALGKTFHLLVYQEQVMQAARDVCGYSLGEADLLRRAMGKKDMEKLDAEKERFFNGGIERGHSQEALQALWDRLVPFANYAFNKPHAVAYATTGYLAAYLKAHYPVEYMAAHLESAANRRDTDEDKDKYLLALAEVRRMGIKMLPPDIHQAFSGFRAEDGCIRYGLDMVKGVGSAVVEDVRENAPYSSLLDYMVRAGKGKNSRVVKSLASSGAMKHLGSRKGIIEAAPDMAKRIGTVSKYKKKDNSLTPENIGVVVESEEYEREVVLALEKEHLGTYVSAHPLDPYKDVIAASHAVPIGTVDDSMMDKNVVLLGSVSLVSERLTKKGKPYGAIKIVDDTGDIRFNVWSSSRGGRTTWGKIKDKIEVGTVVKVSGRWAANGTYVGFEADEVVCLEKPDERTEARLTDFMLRWTSRGIPVVSHDEWERPLFPQASTDEMEVRRMGMNPLATGYSITCGSSTGLLGIRLDILPPRSGAARFKAMIERAGGTIPRTMVIRTPLEERVVLVRVPDEAWKWIREIDYDATGIQMQLASVVGPGSVDPDGVHGLVGEVRTIADADRELLNVLQALCLKQGVGRDAA